MSRHFILTGHIGNPKLRLEDINYQQEQKDVGTLSNPLSGDTKQGGLNAQDDTKLQIERSASLLADSHLAVTGELHTSPVYCKYTTKCQKNCLNQKYCGVRTFLDKWGVDYDRKFLSNDLSRMQV